MPVSNPPQAEIPNTAYSTLPSPQWYIKSLLHHQWQCWQHFRVDLTLASGWHLIQWWNDRWQGTANPCLVCRRFFFAVAHATLDSLINLPPTRYNSSSPEKTSTSLVSIHRHWHATLPFWPRHVNWNRGGVVGLSSICKQDCKYQLKCHNRSQYITMYSDLRSQSLIPDSRTMCGALNMMKITFPSRGSLTDRARLPK